MAITMKVYKDGKEMMETSYEGCVLWTWEENGYHDSDFYAAVWDEETQNLKRIEYDSTRHGGYGNAVIDVTDDVLKKLYRSYKTGKRNEWNSANEKNAKKVEKEKTVKVIRGRKIPKGTTGKVFWVGDKCNAYSGITESITGMIKDDGSKVFIKTEYLEVIEWEQYLISGRKRKELIRVNALNLLPYQYQKMLNNGKEINLRYNN